MEGVACSQSKNNNQSIFPISRAKEICPKINQFLKTYQFLQNLFSFSKNLPISPEFPLHVFPPRFFSSLFAVFDLDDLYLGDLLGVRGAGLEHLHLLVHVGRVHPLGATRALRSLVANVAGEESTQGTGK